MKPEKEDCQTFFEGFRGGAFRFHEVRESSSNRHFVSFLCFPAINFSQDIVHVDVKIIREGNFSTDLL